MTQESEEETEVEEEQDCADSLSNLHSEAEHEIPTSPASSSVQDTVPSEFWFRKAGQNVAIF